MAADEAHFGPVNFKSAVAAKVETPWKHQQSLRRWCLSNDSTPGHEAELSRHEARQKTIGVEDVKPIGRHPPDDGEDESGLELCLGLSLGGSVCKVKPKNGLKDLGGSYNRGGEKVKEEDSPQSLFPKDRDGLTTRVSEGGMSRTQTFWQEFFVSRDSLKEENVSPPDSDAVRERHLQILSGSSIGGRLSMHVEPEIWSSLRNSAGERSKAAFAHQFWQAGQENTSQVDKVDSNEEKPLLKDHLRAPTKAIPTSGWGRSAQGGGAMPLLDRFKDNGERDPRNTISSAGKKSSGASFSVQGNESLNSIQASGIVMNDRSADAGPGPPKQSPSVGKGEVSSQEDNYMSAAEQQRNVQDAMEQDKKHKRQEARKKRKAFLEEQKLQKKAKKDDEFRVASAQSVKQLNQATRAGTPASGSKVSSTGPLPATSREVSIGREVSSPPDSQDGESTNSGFRRAGSTMWQHGGVREGPATSAPEKPLDNAGLFIESDDGKQLREIRRALQRERDRAAKDKGKELGREKQPASRSEDPERRVLPSHEPSGAVSASSVNRLESKAAVQTDSAWMQMNNHPANQLSVERLENKEMLVKILPDLNGIQRKGNFIDIQRRSDLSVIQGRGDVIGTRSRGTPGGFSSLDGKRRETFGQGTVQHPELSEERSRLEHRETEVSTISGVKSNENLTSRSASPCKDVSSTYSGRPLPNVGTGRVPGRTFSHLQSAPILQTKPQFARLQTRSESRESFLFQDSNVNSSSAFSTLVAAGEPSQGQSVAVGSTLDGGDHCPPGSVLSSYIKVDTHDEMSGFTNSSKVGQHGGPGCTESVPRTSYSNEEEGKNVQGNRFQQGTTQTIPTAEGLVVHLGQEASSLKLGIAAGQTFGGSGTSPDLPWVTCTGNGSNGKSICGVLYRYKKGQVRIVCACHGCHMSASEFVQHAGSVDLANPEKSIGVGPFTLGSRAASVQG